MPITSEFDWLTCVEPRQLARYCRGRLDPRRFSWLLLNWVKQLRARLTNEESVFVADYSEWLVGGRLDSPPQPPTWDFHPLRHGECPRDCLIDCFEAWARGELIFAVAEAGVALSVDFSLSRFAVSPPDPSKAHKKKSKKGQQEAAAKQREAWDRADRERTAHRERTLWQFANEFRDVAGNPFRPVAFDPAWRTETVVGLAAGTDEAGAYERLPILADALEGAGCTDPQVLSHAREPGVHVRGCWLIDLILGRWA